MEVPFRLLEEGDIKEIINRYDSQEILLQRNRDCCIAFYRGIVNSNGRNDGAFILKNGERKELTVRYAEIKKAILDMGYFPKKYRRLLF